MARIIVSILSNHSVPNFLFIKEMEGQYDRHLFVTSPEIGQLGRKGQLTKALGITQQDVTIISVDGNDYLSAIATLADKWQEDEDNDYIVNLTGGTKMMSLAVHDFFKNKRAEFYYVPLGKNEYYNLGTGKKHHLNTGLTCVSISHCMAFGLKVKPRTHLYILKARPWASLRACRKVISTFPRNFGMLRRPLHPS